MAVDVLKLLGMCTLLVFLVSFQPDTGAGGAHAAVREAVGGIDHEKKQTWKELPDSIQTKRDIPRMDFHLKMVSNKFCGGNNFTIKHKCSRKYVESLVMTSAPLMLVAAVTLVLASLVLIGRNCCMCFGNGCCGGGIPSQGICFGPPLAKDDGYTPCRRRLYVFLAVTILVLVAAAMCIGFSGNSKLSHAVGQLMNTMESIPEQVNKQIVFINAEILGLKRLSTRVNPGADVSLWTTVMNSLTEIQKSVKHMQNQAGEAHHKVHKYEKMRSDFLKWAFIAAPILAACGIFGYFLPSVITFFVIPLVLLCTILAWVVAGIHVPVAVATADFCVDLDYALKHPNASMGGIGMVLRCGGKKGAGKMLKSGDRFITQSYAKACNALTADLCNAPNVTYVSKHGRAAALRPVKCPAMPCTQNTLHQFMNLTEVADFQYGCVTRKSGLIATVDCTFTDKTVASKQCAAKYGDATTQPCVQNGGVYRFKTLKECAKNCLQNNTKTTSHTIVGNFDILSRFQALKIKKLEPLAECQIIRKGVSAMERTLCWKVVNATDYIIAGLAIIGITFFFGIAVYLGARKVFTREFWAEHYEEYWEGAYGAEEPSLPLLGAERSAADQT